MKKLMLLFTLLVLSCVSSVQMLGDSRAPISSSEVKEFAVLPDGAKEIAAMSISLYSYTDGSESVGQIKKKAASLGANGYCITAKERREGGVDMYGRTRPSSYKISVKMFYTSH